MQTVKIGGETYTLEFGFAAAQQLQSITGVGFMRVGAALLQGGIEHLVQALFVMLRKNHPGVTMEQCAEMVEGNSAAIFKACATLVGQFFDRNSLAAPAETPQKKASGRTPKAS